MEMKNFLHSSKNEWLNKDLLEKISKNPELAKFFTNPEYMNVNKIYVLN